MKLKFGASVDSKSGELSDLIKNIKTALDFSNEAIELCLTRTEKILYDKSITDLLNQFKYRSIHLPVKHKDKFLRYPNKTIEPQAKIEIN